MERIGVYVCECGPNIKEVVDVEAVVKFAQNLDNVVFSKSFGLLCSQEGQALIAKEIRENKLTRLVIAACSPKEHEITFQNVLKDAGLNPFLVQIANIREQCAWVTKDKAVATDKARSLIKAAVERVIYHEPLQVKEIECRPDVLVVGAGIAGISAALTLSQKNRNVYVVEKLPCIGGKAARYEDLYPSLECAACVLDPLLDQALHDENIKFLTLSEIHEVLGYYGNFTVKVKRKARFVDPEACLGCELCFEVCPVKVNNQFNERLNDRKAIYIPYPGALPNIAIIDRKQCLRFQGNDCSACQEACPFGCIDYEENDRIEELKVGAIVLATGFDLFDPAQAPQYGYGRIENIYTGLEFERLLNSNGPTGGEIVLKSGLRPQKVAIVHCVGSRTSRFNEHCSGICCLYSLKFAHQIRKKLPQAAISMLYSDLCLPGKTAQVFFNMVAQKGKIEFHRLKAPDTIQIDTDNQKALIQYTDVFGESATITADMVILATAIEGAIDAGDLAAMLDIPLEPDRFFAAENPLLASVSTLREGVFIAGCAQGPMDIQSAAEQGQAAAGKILSKLIPGEKLAIEAITAQIDNDLCSACKVCVDLCVYRAISSDDSTKKVLINEILCRGCGVCAAVCPSGAITAKHFSNAQISAEIKGLESKNNPGDEKF